MTASTKEIVTHQNKSAVMAVKFSTFYEEKTDE